MVQSYAGDVPGSESCLFKKAGIDVQAEPENLIRILLAPARPGEVLLLLGGFICKSLTVGIGYYSLDSRCADIYSECVSHCLTYVRS